MITYTRHPEHDLTLFVSKGDTTIDEWLDTLKQYGAEGITKYELFDLKHHSNLFSSQEIERIIGFVSNNAKYRPPETKTALVVDKAAMYGVSRVYDILAEIEGIEGLVTEVFYNIDEAIEWLGEQVKDTLQDYCLSAKK